MKKLRNSKSSRFGRHLSRQRGREALQELAYRIRETLTRQETPSHPACLNRPYNVALASILLGLGYESSLVEMLGRSDGR